MNNTQITISVPIYITATVGSEILKKHNQEILSKMTEKIQLCINAWAQNDNNDLGTDIEASLSQLGITVHEVVAIDANIACKTNIN